MQKSDKNTLKHRNGEWKVSNWKAEHSYAGPPALPHLMTGDRNG